MTVLVYDTETTGIYNDKLPVDHPDQPYIVQLGAQLYADDGKRLLAQIDVMLTPIDPNGESFDIPEVVSKIHGIYTMDAMSYGLQPKSVLNLFNAYAARADVCVAHNGKFDRNVLATMAYRYQGSNVLGQMDPGRHFCTMEALTSVCKLPATPAMLRAGRGPYKPPKLIEAYRFLFNEDFEGAHNAMADVQACARIYFEIQRRDAESQANWKEGLKNA